MRRWADKLLAKSPTALRMLKHSFVANSEPAAHDLSFGALDLYLDSEEAREGVVAFNESRPPDFSRWR